MSSTLGDEAVLAEGGADLVLEVDLEVHVGVEALAPQRVLDAVVDRQQPVQEQEVSVLLRRVLLVLLYARGQRRLDPLVYVVSKDA